MRKTIKFSITATIEENEASKVANDLQVITSKATTEEIGLIRKVFDNPIVKNMALAQARKVLS